MPQIAPVVASGATSGPRRASGPSSSSSFVKSSIERVIRPTMPGPTSKISMNASRLSASCAAKYSTSAPTARWTASGHELVEHREEACLLVSELLMERLRRDTRELRDLWIAELAVALVERQVDDRAERTRAAIVVREEYGSLRLDRIRAHQPRYVQALRDR